MTPRKSRTNHATSGTLARFLRVDRGEVHLLLIALGVAALVLLGVVAARVAFSLDFRRLTIDPATSVGFPRYTGALSYAAVVAWFVAATTAAFAAIIVGVPDRRRFLLGLAAASAWLGLDDLFLLHEWAGRKITGSEAGEDIVFAVYVVAVLSLLWRWRPVVRASPASILLLSGGFFAISILLDRPDADLPGQFLLEDGAKVVGVTLWAAYGWATARRFVVDALARTARPGD